MLQLHLSGLADFYLVFLIFPHEAIVCKNCDYVILLFSTKTKQNLDFSLFIVFYGVCFELFKDQCKGWQQLINNSYMVTFYSNKKQMWRVHQAYASDTPMSTSLPFFFYFKHVS